MNISSNYQQNIQTAQPFKLFQEQSDFDTNFMSDNIDSESLVPKEIASKDRELIVNAFDKLSGSEKLMATMIFTPENVMVNSNGVEMNRDNHLTNLKDIFKRIETIINPEPHLYSSPELKEIVAGIRDDIKEGLDKQNPTHYQTQTKESEKPKEKTAGQQFLEAVREAGGTLNYLQQLNYEKIEKLIEEKRDELKQKYGADNPELSKEELSTITKSINEELEDFRKDLMKKLEANSSQNINSSNRVSLEQLLKEFS